MDEAFVRVIRDHRLLAPGDRALVGISGGADSVALLSLLLRNAPALGISVVAAHLDHRLRAESGADAAFVGRFCAELGVPLMVGVAEVAELARAGGEGIEAAARRARREFLLEAAAARGCSVIALGHHAGDQAETFLHRLLRGSGTSGLAAMALRNGPFIRPLLPFTHQQLLAFLARRQLPHVEDASNLDPAFTRNRIRHELLPRLRTFNPRIDEHLVALSQRLLLEEDFWRDQETEALAAVSRPASVGVELDRRALLALHPALRIRVLRRALERLRGDLLEISAGHLAAVEALLTGSRPQGELSLPRAWVGRRYQRLLLRSEAPRPAEPFRMELAGPGCHELPGGGRLQVSIASSSGPESPTTMEFDGERIGFPLLVRTFLPGDRFRPDGGGGAKKLKDYFIDARIEREERARLPLLVGPEILWVVGLRRCAGYRPDNRCRRVLRVVFRAARSSTIGL